MKENSNGTDTNVGSIGNGIEEDIEILERFSNENVIYGATVGMTLEKYKDLQLSTEHILSDYKRVLKENEQLSTEVNSLKKENKDLKTELKDSVIATKLYTLQTENEKQKELIERMKRFLLKENKMWDFLESEE